MVRTHISIRSIRALVLVALLVFALAACGSADRGSVDADASDSIPVPQPTFVISTDDLETNAVGIDQTKIDVCALIPRDTVEAAIGALGEPPQKSLAIGQEVGCDYVAEKEARGYSITVYNLDRWDLIGQVIDDATPISGIGDGAYIAKKVGGGTQIYVLLRDRAVVSTYVSGADTPQFRQLLDLALAQVQAYHS